MASQPPLVLTTAVTPHRHYQALRDGTVRVPGVEIEHVERPQVEIFRGMARDLAFDVAEMSVVSYLCAKQYGIPFSAIPVVPRTAFHHGDFLVNVHAGIKEPKDLEGKRVGTRTYTVTPGTLDRGILMANMTSRKAKELEVPAREWLQRLFGRAGGFRLMETAGIQTVLAGRRTFL
jgi:hypothetical protein